MPQHFLLINWCSSFMCGIIIFFLYTLKKTLDTGLSLLLLLLNKCSLMASHLTSLLFIFFLCKVRMLISTSGFQIVLLGVLVGVQCCLQELSCWGVGRIKGRNSGGTLEAFSLLFFPLWELTKHLSNWNILLLFYLLCLHIKVCFAFFLQT